jgi:hypothetical protein
VLRAHRGALAVLEADDPGLLEDAPAEFFQRPGFADAQVQGLNVAVGVLCRPPR